MTTIASNGLTVAADGRAMLGDEPIRDDIQKIYKRDGRVLAFTGSTRFQPAAIEWGFSGFDPEKQPVVKDKDDAWSVAEYFPDCVVVYNDSCPYPFTYPYPFAMGSGQDYALGALAAGATPERAIEIAIRFNVRTGGKIMSIDVPRDGAMKVAAE